jgi:hypothetical protein
MQIILIEYSIYYPILKKDSRLFLSSITSTNCFTPANTLKYGLVLETKLFFNSVLTQTEAGFLFYI